ncbi:MAG: bifunctional ornithine acetyltransferase/N-acetylglutamate synthase, partial [Dehalococcoidia bacterium]
MISSLEYISDGTITSPRGFLAGATYAGIKRPDRDALDLGILYSEALCVASGVFTTNRIKAAPVILSHRRLGNSRAQAIVINSGCANACTSEQGLIDAEGMADMTANMLGLSSELVLVASTGVIGRHLPMDLIQNSIEQINLSKNGGHELAKAITTTDRFPKETAIRLNPERQGSKINIGGIAKGSGMIHPDLATLLCFLTTDAAVEHELLTSALNKAVGTSFNMVTVDGDTSPNDSVFIMANGLCGGDIIQAGTPEAEDFAKGLKTVCITLARLIA